MNLVFRLMEILEDRLKVQMKRGRLQVEEKSMEFGLNLDMNR